MNEPSMAEIHRRRKWLQTENRRWPRVPILVPVEDWPPQQPGSKRPIAIWRSCDFLIHVFTESPGLLRLSVCRSEIGDDGNFLDNISWDMLQRLKCLIGFAELDAVEIYPAAEDVVNVANMRHLWILDEPISFKWRSKLSTNPEENQTHEKTTRRF